MEKKMVNSEQEAQRDENRDEHSSGETSSKRYTMRQDLIAIGDDYWIENEQGEKVYRVDGKVLHLHKTFYIKDMNGKELAKLKKFIAVKEKMEITKPDGEQLALVTKDLFTPLKEHFVIKINNGPELEVHGNIIDHEYKISDGQNTIADVSKALLKVRDNYSILVKPGQDDFIILAVVVCVDAMTHD
jgi:uncharacterized protein YxjI